MKYKVLIVDDEEPARDLLENYVEKIEELELVASVNDGLKAKKIISTSTIDILLSDIQMEDFTGIDLVKTLKNPPATIFTTAYSEYALEGYTLNVIDYLVKPISFQRFCTAIDKAIELNKYTNKPVLTKDEEEDQVSKGEETEYFFVKTNRKLVKVNYRDILYIQSFGEYVKIFTENDVIMALQTTSYMEEILPKAIFVRVHRSYIVNINQIKEIEGNQIVIEKHWIPISKRMREPFMQIIKTKKIV